MSDMTFSESQKIAIKTKGKTLLVSAGAGSGKTTVMTQRILEHIKEGTDVSEILVVTFTKAAAANMKDKLYDALLKESALSPSDVRLARSVYMIPSAKISTIHSFCFDLVKSNFELLSLPPSLRVADTGESSVMFEECIEKCIEELFENDDKDFISLCDNFTGEKSLEAFKKTAKTVYDKYRSFPFWKDYVKKGSDTIRLDEEKAKKEGFIKCSVGVKLRKTALRYIESAKKAADTAYDTVAAAEHTESHLTPLELLCDSIDSTYAELIRDDSTYTDIANTLEGLEIKSSYTRNLAPDVSRIYKDLKNEAADLVKETAMLFAEAENEAISDYENAIRINDLMNGFIFKVDEELKKVKKERGVLEFSDLEQYTLELLGENTAGGVIRTPLCKDLRKTIKEIYIDEYQDINPIQDMIFELISRDDDRFMVGDVKQSIYRFRNASADIFLGYLRDFGDVSDAGSKRAKIFLSENYRSKKPILDFVNILFDELYNENTVGASYENERLIYGKSGNDTEAFPVEVHAFSNKKATEKEAEFVAEKILSLVGNGVCGYGDIAVLLRSPSGSAIELRYAFLRRGIPFAIEKGVSFFGEPEILLALSILRTMDDPLDDVSLASSLRSPVFGFSADDIYSLKRRFAYNRLFDCVKRGNDYYVRHKNKGKKYVSDKPYSSVGRKAFVFQLHGTRTGKRPSGEVYEKCAYFMSMLSLLRSPGAVCPSSRMIWNMYSVTNLVSLCAAEKDGKKRVKNLNKLYSLALEYEKTSFRGLSGFLAYVNETSEDYDKNNSEDVSDPNCVRIMSFHSSKGLEFPVCFVSALGKKFNFSDTWKNYVIADNGFVYYDLDYADGVMSYTPIVKRMAEEDEKKAIMREELRCLYVALTRAKDRLFVTGKGEIKKENDDFFTAKDCMSWIYPILDGKESPCFELYAHSDDAEDVESKETEETTEKEEKPFVPDFSEKTEYYPFEVFRRALDCAYAYGDGSTVPSKASVSEMRKGILEDDEYTRALSESDARRVPVFASDRDDRASAGSATHLFMQFADFGNVLEKGVVPEIERLKKIRMISDADASLMNVRELEAFFRSALCREIMASDCVMREKRFNIIEDSESFSGVKGESVMVQGVIDCFFRNSDGTFTVVDYKTDRVKKENGDETLVSRHSFQLGYYCRAVEQMTGAKVSRALLYSFCLGREVEVKP